MAKKPKHRRAGAAAIHSQDISVLIAAASRALAEGRHKEAVETYKELLKREQRAEWQEALADAYAGRAGDLAAKGMLKEAMAVWRTRAELCGAPLMTGPYLQWLVQSGDTKTLLSAYVEACAGPEEEGMGKVRAALEHCLAPIVLAAPEADLAGFPADSPLLVHRPAALAALRAYCAAEETLEAHLASIPFRSPYRDLRPLLKAMALGERDPEGAAALLAKLPVDSPFERLAAAARVALVPVHELLDAITALDDSARRLAFELRGIPEGVRVAIEELAKQRAQTSPGALFDWLMRHRRLWPQGDVEALCRSLLPNAHDRMPVYRKTVGKLSPVDEARINAVRAESSRYVEDAIDWWLETARHLQQRNGEGDALRAALILRHLAGLDSGGPGGVRGERSLDWLRQSLTLDPEHLETSLRLLRAYREAENLKAARTLLDDALKRFPENPDVLLEAMEIALAGNAFKKAVGYARMVLKYDPINPRVRSSLGLAHMAHARKQIRGGKPDAARKELSEADEWLRSGMDRGALKLLCGFLEQDQGRIADAGRLFQEGIAELGGELVGLFHLAMEAVRLGRDPAGTMKRLGVKPPKKAAVAADVIHLVRVLDGQKVEPKVLRAAVEPFSALLRKAASLRFSEQEDLLICEALHRFGMGDLFAVYSKAARRRHPRSPIFVYHDLVARYGNSPWRMSDREFEALDEALDWAVKSGDSRTAMRIRELLERASEPFGEGPHAFEMGGAPMSGDEIRAPLEALLRMMGEKTFLDMIRSTVGEKAFRELEGQAGKDNLVERLIDLMVEMGPPPGFGFPQPYSPPPVKPKAAKRKGGDFPPDQGDLFDD